MMVGISKIATATRDRLSTSSESHSMVGYHRVSGRPSSRRGYRRSRTGRRPRVRAVSFA